MGCPDLLTNGYEQNLRSGLYVPERLNKKRPTCIDFFCGAGGFSLGMIQAGFEVVAGLDFDHYCMVTYLINLGGYPVNIYYSDGEIRDKAAKYLEKSAKRFKKEHGIEGLPYLSGSARPPDQPPVQHFFLGDMRTFSGAFILEKIGMKPGEVDCIVGGPPCQGFSMAGKREVMDPRNSMIFEFAERIIEIQPKTFVMENVPGILSMVTPDGIPVIDQFCLMLDKGGYGAYKALKNSLMTTSGAGAAVKASKKANNRKQWKKSKADKTDGLEQMSLF